MTAAMVYVAERPPMSTLATRDAGLKIAMLAPPWLPIPPPGYGGIESVIDSLCHALVGRGHDVALFAAPGSGRLPGARRARLAAARRDRQGDDEARHVSGALALIDREAELGRPFDVIHDHNEAVTVAFADRIAVPVVHTVHGPFTAEARDLYARNTAALLVGLSRAQLTAAPSEASVHGAIANPLDVADWPFVARSEGHLVWLGRFAPEKGAHVAIRAARLARQPLVLAGPVQPGQEEYFDREIAPHIDDAQVRYVGEVGGEAKNELLAGADAMLMPISWPEPFGMVMIEAMACGTPVIAFDEGSAPEVVRHGVGGLIVADVEAMARAVGEVAGIIGRDAAPGWRSSATRMGSPRATRTPTERRSSVKAQTRRPPHAMDIGHVRTRVACCMGQQFRAELRKRGYGREQRNAVGLLLARHPVRSSDRSVTVDGHPTSSRSCRTTPRRRAVFLTGEKHDVFNAPRAVSRPRR